jgi:hypothetical protein
MSDNSGVQPWSQGMQYPFIVVGRETEDGTRYGVLLPDGSELKMSRHVPRELTCAIAHKVAEQLAEARRFDKRAEQSYLSWLIGRPGKPGYFHA